MIVSLNLRNPRISIGGPHSLQLSEIEVPSDLSDYEVLVRNRYTAISPGTELSIYTGSNPLVYRPGSWCNYPHVPGYAGLGEVVAVGPRVSGISAGDKVFHHAHHSRYDVVQTDYLPCVRISPELVVPEVSLVRFAAIVTSSGIRQSKIELGDKIAVFGLGLIGQIAVQLFSLAGADVYGFDLVGGRRNLAEQIGACVGVFDPQLDLNDQTQNLTYGRSFDTVVDATGSSSLILKSIDLVRPLGQFVLLGAPFAGFDANLTDFLRQIFLRRLKVIGALELDRIDPPSDYVAHPYLFDVDYGLGLIRRGKLKTRELVSRVIAPREFKGAYEGLLNDKEEYVSVVVDWDGV